MIELDRIMDKRDKSHDGGEIYENVETGRQKLVLYCQAGFDAGVIDLEDLLIVVKSKLPNMWKKVQEMPCTTT